jgi:hypothetical protein
MARFLVVGIINMVSSPGHRVGSIKSIEHMVQEAEYQFQDVFYDEHSLSSRLHTGIKSLMQDILRTFIRAHDVQC